MTTTFTDDLTLTDPAAPDLRPNTPVSAAGWAALVKAGTYLSGFVVLGAWLAPKGLGDGGPVEQLDFVLDHQAVLYAWNVLLYLVGGAALAVLALGLDQLLSRAALPALLRRVTTFTGLLWAGLLVATGLVATVGQSTVAELHSTDPDRAATVWAALHGVQESFGGGIEVVGGTWALLMALAGLRYGVLGRGPAVLAAVTGIAGLVTVVPVLEPAAAVFGLGLLVWFVWVGIRLLRTRQG